MQEYIKKLEAENSRLTELLGKKENLGVPTMPRLDNLLITFGIEWTYDGGVEKYQCDIRHLYVNEITGSDEDKLIKTYSCANTKLPSNIWDVHDVLKVGVIIREMDADLSGFYNLRLFDFTTPWRTTEMVAPWTRGEGQHYGSIVASEWDFNSVAKLFREGHMYTIKPLKRVTRWKRLKQLMKGI